ncbi:23S rRNA pseudouridine(1911/1915/1917) synthase RluD [Gammaproteobacteria bacterium]|nr:23S rRNA pseudouridine(1911/1915/1917) synthase RluD [Gammaproteobacteria bacterium]
MLKKIQLDLIIPEEMNGMRLDQALSQLLAEDYSRTTIKEWIINNEVKVDSKETRAKEKVLGGEKIQISANIKIYQQFEPEALELNIIHEDNEILIINKPSGMVVHPAPGNKNNTLLNALLHHSPSLKDMPRAGIVHRLDKNTSGLLVVAKTSNSLKSLTLQLKKRTVKRIYQAIVYGEIITGGTIDHPIARHPTQRKKMAIIDNGKTAITHYRIGEKYRAFTKLKVQLETGRTHQIRVHFAHIRHPLLGDQTYGHGLKLPKNASSVLIDKLKQFRRQALHASELGLIHPETKELMNFNSPLPTDMIELIEVLKSNSQK